MHGSRLVSGLAAVFGGTAALFAVLGLVYSPVFLVVAALFGAVTYLTWYHASGRLAERVYRGVERQAATADGGRGGFGAGPREEWRPPRDGERTGDRRRTGRRTAREGTGRANRRRTARGTPGNGTREDEPSPADYRVLGLEPGADESAVRSAYRSRVKEVHPDTDGGDEEAFKRVKTAYERLTGETA